MMVFSPVFGGICSIVGLYLSWAFNLPTGGTIVLSMVAAFVLVWAVTAVRSRARAQPSRARRRGLGFKRPHASALRPKRTLRVI